MKTLQNIYDTFSKHYMLKGDYVENIKFTGTEKILLPVDKMVTYIVNKNKECSRKNWIELDETNIKKISQVWISSSHTHKCLVNSLNDYVHPKHLTYMQLIASYMNTIREWAKKYKLSTLELLIIIFNDAFEEVLFYECTTMNIHLYELAMFVIAEECKDKVLTNQDDRIFFIKVFNIVFIFSMAENIPQAEIKEYINMYGIDIYKRFISEICTYINLLEEETIEDILDNKTKELLSIFINQYIKAGLVPEEIFEKYLIIFAEKGFFDRRGLKLLRMINSPYIDKYKSLLLMKDIKEW